MYHLGWFLANGFGIGPWQPQIGAHALGVMNSPWTGRSATEWTQASLYTDILTSLERAGFDFMLIEDTAYLLDDLNASSEMTLKHGLFAPKNDPMPLVPLLAERTRHIGIVPTVTSSFYHPFAAARLFATLDHLTEGRVGFNFVTGSKDRVFENHGIPMPSKSERYAQGHEWVEVFRKLLASWQPDAVLADPQRGIYADHTKVHRIDHVGPWYQSRGPLSTQPGPQGIMPMVQAGNSEEGRDITARYSEVMLAVGTNVAKMKALREDMHRRMRAYGRDPSQLKLLFMVNITLGMTDEEALARDAALTASRSSQFSIENMMWKLAQTSRMDFSKYDLDMPMAEIERDIHDKQDMNEVVSTVAHIFATNRHKTLREALTTMDLWPGKELGLIGSPETVAARMDEAMQEIGGDGFLINAPSQRVAVAEICDGLAPVLRRRGSIRSGYDGKTFRENLLAF